MRIILAVLLGVLALPALAEDQPRQISVTGEGRVSAEPDMAIVQIGVSREAPKASEAMAATSDAANAVLEEIEAAGIAPRDVQTANISLTPRWQNTNNSRPRIIGYAASINLTVRARALPSLGQLLDAVVSDGANQMNGLSFSMADPRPLQDAARQMAVKDARAKAELLAEAAGVTVGAVVSISENGAGRPVATMARSAMMEASAVPIAAGEVDVNASVSIIFAIGE